MAFEDSPTLEEFADGALTPPPDKTPKKRRASLILGSLVLLIMVLLGMRFIQSDDFEAFAGQGSLSGYAVDESGQPILVEVLVFGTELKVFSDENGYFEISNVPAGERSVIIAYEMIGTEKIVSVKTGENTDLGTVIVPTEMEIDY